MTEKNFSKKSSPVQKKKKSASKTSLPDQTPSPSLRLYRRLAVGFVIFVALILGAILFVSTAKVHIAFSAKENSFQTTFSVSIKALPTTQEDISGKVVQKAVNQSKSFPVQAKEQKEEMGQAGGVLTIYNNRHTTQTLVATTRFLSSTGVLFRLADSVIIPAKGTKTAYVYADEIGPKGDIGPDTFTIPGLPLMLQQQVYATSSEPMTGGLRLVSSVSQEEIDQAAILFEQELLEQTKEELRKEQGDFDGEWFFVENKQQTSDTLPGEETDSYTISLQFDVTGLFYDEVSLKRIGEEHLYKEVEKGNQIKEILWEEIMFTLKEKQEQTQEVQAEVVLSGISIPSLTHPELDPEIFVGKSKEEIRQYFISHELATDVQVDFFPPWIRSAPQLKDHIDIVIKE